MSQPDEQSFDDGLVTALRQADEALRRNIVTWIALAPLLDEPYPDDPRWTPYTRFAKRAMRQAGDARKAIREALQ